MAAKKKPVPKPKKRWRVTAQRTQYATIVVEAADDEDPNELAKAIWSAPNAPEIVWDGGLKMRGWYWEDPEPVEDD